MKKKFCVLFIISCLILPVFAAEWKQIAEKDYIDISSVKEFNDGDTYSKKRYNRNEKEFWIKQLNDKSSYFTNFEKNYNKKVWYTMSKMIVDCNNKTLATKSFLIYDTNGKVIDQYEEEYDSLLKRNQIIPETKGEYWCDIVCTYFEEPKIKISAVDKSNNNFDDVIDKFEPYFDNLYKDISEQWKPKTYNDTLECEVSFTIAKDGKLLNTKIFNSSGNSKFDNEAVKTIKYNAPFQPLPKEFNGRNLEIFFTFKN